MNLKNYFPFFREEFVELLNKNCEVVTIAEKQQILRKGQYVKVIPVVLRGMIRVFTTHEDKELLLYHIRSSESCIMSFAAGIKNGTSEIYAQTIEETELLLFPTDQLKSWLKEYPELYTLFNSQYELRYKDLLNTIEHMVFLKMDERILKLLQEKASFLGSNVINISHKELADDLATSREVVSRVLKKMEHENQVELAHQSIKLL